ncbi:tetratricopeptide repeat protein [Hymenobacter sp. HMF4947]|uniref:histidine kinase n=1 Tax=Hymenobacter ginkgonis TaxID=2682976 RepID=A0A7K1TCW1_9BACT|nr:histidine kinase dimerization/phosphoacceptor domain -containing protein [Hymenobacter ginkgonis]MVN76021.1 tetratricopeptide repeat protein [Hymenobacter ginkgonis]
MAFSFLVGRRLLLLLVLLSFVSRAEPIYPLLSPAAVSRLRAQLRHSRPDTNQLKLRLQLTADLLARYEELGIGPDSIVAFAEQAGAASERLHFAVGRIGSFYILGRVQCDIAGDTSGTAAVRQGISLSQRQGRRHLEALGWYYLGNCYPQAELNRSAKLVYYQRAKSLFHQLGARVEEAYLLKCLADVHLLQGHSMQAAQELRQVAAWYRAAGHRELHYTYDLLEAAYQQAGNYKEALRYALAAIESAQATHDTLVIGGFYAKVGGIYHDLHQEAPALTYYHKALASYRQAHVAGSVIQIAGAIARILIAQHKPQQALAFFTQNAQPGGARNQVSYLRYLADCYVAVGRNHQAEACFLRALSLIKSKADNNFNQVAIHRELGSFYLRTQRYDQARWYLQQALQFNQRKGALPSLARLHLLMFRVDSAQARFPAAIAHYQRYKLLTDSMFNEVKNKQLLDLEIQYDTRKKEQNIALLTKQNLVQQARIRQREWQRNTLLAGAALLALLLGLGYNRYRLKQRSAHLLEAKQQEINLKNDWLEQLVSDKQGLLEEKEDLLDEKEELLQEKDWMLKEIHHRVKNNLQIISSLLNTQAEYLRDPAALAALRESQNRVQAMALVHQKLYQSDSVARVNMPEYIREITEHLLDSFDCADSVRAQVAVAPIELDVALATPLGLIINEAVTNALKHAFPQRRPGTLSIRLQPRGAHHYELLIADDGVGLPPGFDLRHSQSLGLTMVTGLSKQLDGLLHITQDHGVRLTLQFEATRKAVRAETAPA